jgi:copper(I)-binding protein
MTFFKTAATSAALVLSALLAVPAFAHDTKTIGDITVSSPWTRATPPRARAGGGFAKIVNAGGEDRLVSASANVSKRTELHEMTVADGVMKMREMADGIPVPAGGTLELKPGSYHVMFFDLTGPLKEGENVPVTLTFEKAGEVTLDFKVERIGAKGPEHGEHAGGEMDHGTMDHGTMDHSTMDHGKTDHGGEAGHMTHDKSKD